MSSIAIFIRNCFLQGFIALANEQFCNQAEKAILLMSKIKQLVVFHLNLKWKWQDVFVGGLRSECAHDCSY